MRGSSRPSSARSRGCSEPLRWRWTGWRRRVAEAGRGAAGREAGRVGAAGRVVVCPTPIGNLEDVTLRVLAVLRGADVVACEDTRRTRVLLDRHGIRAREL